MRQQQPHLSDLFAKARSEPPVISEQEIDRLLDGADLHGRQSTPEETAQMMTPAYSHNRKRRIVMGSIAALLLGTFISTGIFFLSPDSPQHNSRTPAIAAVPAPTNNEPSEAKKKAMPVETATTLSAPVATETTSIGTLNGREEDGTAYVPVDKEKKEEKRDDIAKSEIGEKISKELQKLVESYWVDKINGYKARIDGMMSPTDLDELNRLRVRWALVEKEEESPFAFAAMMEMNAVNAHGDKAQIKTSVGNSDDAESVDLPALNGTGKGQVRIALGVKSEHTDESIVENENGRVVRQNKEVFIFRNDQQGDQTELENAEDGHIAIVLDKDATTIDQGDRTIILRRSEDGRTTEQTMPAFTIDGEIDPTEFESMDSEPVAIVIDENKEMSITDQGDRTIVIRRQKMGKDAEGMEEGIRIESLNMTPIIEMMKMSVRSDEHESSRIMVAAWDMAEEHRAGLDDLKATVKGDVKVFIELIRERMSDFVTEHGDELPTEMRDMMTEKLEAEGETDRTGNMIESLDPFYDVLVEPMLLLYNGSDINGMLTSAIAEPVAGITLEANSTLKQSYPNPASTEATIEYTLQEPSASTVLRLFDAQGGEVKNLNLGAQSAGNHRAMVDVRDLPGGTYLYHLTLATPRGEQVFSKTMQITR